MITGCMSQPLPIAVEQPDFQPTKTHVFLPSVIPTSTGTANRMITTPSPLPSEAFCKKTGVIKNVEIPSPTLGEKLRMRIYLPPCYQKEKEGGYPLLVLLHGQNGQDDQWINLGLTKAADSLILSNEIPAIVMVFPWERLYLLDWRESHFGEALTEDLMAYILAEYNINPARDQHAIGGISRGASWAVQVGMESPQLFGVIGGHSFPSFGGEIRKLPVWIEQFDPLGEPALYFDIGKYDRYKRYCDPFMEALTQQGVEHQYIINEGAHNNEYWQEHIIDYLTWYGKTFSGTDLVDTPRQ